MRIDAVKPGTTYAYRDGNRGTPVPVRAEEIVLDEPRRRTRFDPVRTKRLVRVTFLEGYHHGYRSIEKGASKDIEARCLIGDWSEYADEVDADRRLDAEAEAVAAYLTSLLPDGVEVEGRKGMNRSHLSVEMTVDTHTAILSDAKGGGFYKPPEPMEG